MGSLSPSAWSRWHKALVSTGMCSGVMQERLSRWMLMEGSWIVDDPDEILLSIRLNDVDNDNDSWLQA